MALELYWASGSCNSWRVQLALEIKKVPYQAHLLTMSKGEHKSLEFLAINPRGKVPAIRDGAFTLSESVAILLYLDRKYPEPPLFGQTPEESGRVLRKVLDLVYHLEPRLDRVVLPIYQGKLDAQADAVRTAAAELHQELATLESSLAHSPFLVGSSLSAADCTALSFIEHLLRGAGKPSAQPLDLAFLPLAQKYPALAGWLDRMRALPGYERTYPPHWR